ncbi:PfkB family carbohydrate kinase, partial [Streptomyces caniscabiei]|uniref:PfkB family carbohydrate kinase n=1 Tax=Streptomyces caniscabiei TaxID=2746961 RepID=UPI00211AE51B
MLPGRPEGPVLHGGDPSFGECVADAFAEPPAAANELALRVLPGGGPANTAVALARLGTPARFLARLSGDLCGRLFRAHLEASGVD